jgi:hypothetical protein
MDWGNLEGLIPILGGTYGLLLAHGVWPRRPTSPRLEEWRRKHGKLLRVISPLVIAFGVLQLCGMLR